MSENKTKFVTELGTLLKQTRQLYDLDYAEYVENASGEFVFLYFKSGAKKIVNITMDSCFAVIKDVVEACR